MLKLVKEKDGVGCFRVSGKQLKIGTFQQDSVALLLRIGGYFSDGLSGIFTPEYAFEIVESGST